MNTPKVSVIVPNYNYSSYLAERLDSILSQTFQDFELIILDDCSTDASQDIIMKYQKNKHVSQIVFNEKNTGIPFLQWEKGIELAKGEWIWIAESDDIAQTTFLSTLIAEADTRSKAVVAFSHSIFIDSESNDMHIDWHNNTDGKTRIYTSDSFIRKKLLWSCYIYNASMAIFRREIFMHMERSFRDYRAKGDWAFWMNICLQGDVIEVCKPLNYFRQHPKNATEHSHQNGSDWEECSRVLRSFKKLVPMNALQRIHFRGHWTYDFLCSSHQDKVTLINKYPELYGGYLWECAYSRLIEKIRRIII